VFVVGRANLDYLATWAMKGGKMRVAGSNKPNRWQSRQVFGDTPGHGGRFG
jgi:hypothetical protein